MSQTIARLHKKIVQESANLSKNYVQRHVTLMRRHSQAVINSHGGHIGYDNDKLAMIN